MEAGAAVCPWPFLNQVSSPVKEVPKATSPTTKPKSFAQVLSKSFSFPLCQLPKPCIKGEAISIRISEDEYQQGLLSCKNNLHGRLILPKGSTPIKVNDLKEKLSKLWNPVAQWKLIPLGKGFFEISFASVDDLRNIWMVGTWNLQPGLLRLSQWSADFNPSKMRQTHAQCWIRLYNLPMEYWRPKTLCEIAAGVGTPIALDEATKNKQFGHFARVLVDIDLAKMLPAEILVERESFAFFVSLEYEKLPLFCSFCGSIGHSLEQCRKKDPQPMNKPKIDKPFQNSTEHARQKSAHTETKVVQDTHATIPLNPMDHLDKVQEINKNSDNTPSDEVQNTIIESQEDVNPTPAQVENQIAIIPPEISNADISVQKPCGVVSADFQEGHLEIFLNGIENQESTQSVCEKDVADVLQVQHQTPLEIDHVSPTQDADGWNGSMNPRVLHDMRILSKFWGDVVDETDEDIPPDRPSQELNQDVNFTMVLPKSQKHRLKKGAKQSSKHKEPDIAAPGVDILAAWSPISPVAGVKGDERKANYNIISGTSMACPHVTAVAAYIKSFHPDWSPAAIKSAIMTTATPMSVALNPEAEFAYGAGQINPAKAVNPGLVYDASEIDYVKFLCGQGYDTKNLRSITADNSSCTQANNGTVWDLNLPSFVLSMNTSTFFSRVFHRTVTNVGSATSKYKARVVAPPSLLNIKVEPDVLSFSFAGQKKSFTLRIEGIINVGIVSSSLVWDDGNFQVRSPIVVYAE